LHPTSVGNAWLVDAHGCEAKLLRSQETLVALFDRVVRELGLQPVIASAWHLFAGGEDRVSGVLLLSESHLACHTFPERGLAIFDLYSTRPLKEWPWADRLSESLGAQQVSIRSAGRGQP
jgi:S-adenosylmethionine decarboxylase